MFATDSVKQDSNLLYPSANPRISIFDLIGQSPLQPYKLEVPDGRDAIVAVKASQGCSGLVVWACASAAALSPEPSRVSRVRGIDPKYLALWKRKLIDAPVASERDEPPRLVPVVVRSGRATSSPTEVNAASTAVAIRLNLSNGMSVSLEVAAGGLVLVRELAAVRC